MVWRLPLFCTFATRGWRAEETILWPRSPWAIEITWTYPSDYIQYKQWCMQKFRTPTQYAGSHVDRVRCRAWPLSMANWNSCIMTTACSTRCVSTKIRPFNTIGIACSSMHVYVQRIPSRSPHRNLYTHNIGCSFISRGGVWLCWVTWYYNSLCGESGG